MTGSLDPTSVAAYQRDGILFPIRAMSEAEAARATRELETLEAREGGRLSRNTNQKSHILLPSLNRLIRDPAILDAVESILGPNLLCWGSGFFIKNVDDRAFISWHQDSTYWGLSSADVVTAWVAFTPSTPESGCMRVIPGTQTADQVAHRDTFAEGNLLSRGQEIAVAVDENQAVDVVLQPGEMSLHHVRIFHGSGQNHSRHRRIGFAIRYIPTSLSQLGARTTASLVRGSDEYGHFDLEPIPRSDFDPDAVAFHADAVGRLNTVLYAGAAPPTLSGQNDNHSTPKEPRP
jgi:ectoine hydroxylase-related dioxygenase (phytanoyl-CoA dioxygenase family)